MSLLMDALKRAETGKHAAALKHTDEKPGKRPSDFKLEPIATRSTNASQPLHDLAQPIDSLNTDLEANVLPAKPCAPKTTAQPPRSTLEADENRAAIRNAFAAKEAKPPVRKSLWLAAFFLGIVLIGIGTLIGAQWQSLNPGLSSATNSLPPTATTSLAAQPATAPQAAAPIPAIPIFAPNSSSTVPSDKLPAKSAEALNKPMENAETGRNNQSTQVRENAATLPLRLTRSQEEPDATLQRGYANLQGNSLDLARRDYEQAVRNDPNNVDALLGLAAIAQRQGRNSDAERYQQRALIADPRDAGAQAAGLGSNEKGNQASTESRLKTLLAAQPESAQLNFALGNVYARQARWNEAQQVYFNAVAGDIDNPDYLFNLAVSLDQLHQPKLAAQHYRMALDAAEHRPAAFDRERTHKRLSQLTP